MKYSLHVILIFIALTLVSCFEVIEDITVHRNGSGTYKFIVNLSQSKNQIDKIRTQDSILHFKVPTTAMADAKINEVKNKLKSIEGISNVTITQDHTNYIYHLSCDFKNVTSLNNAILNVWKTYDKKAPAALSLYSYENGIFKRNTTVSELEHITQLAGSQERELLQKANYTVICRFDTTIAISNSMNYSLSPSKKATLYKKDVWSTIADKGISNNIITITQ
jgi:hypothetical protein